jgi:hypothetical protein
MQESLHNLRLLRRRRARRWSRAKMLGKRWKCLVDSTDQMVTGSYFSSDSQTTSHDRPNVVSRDLATSEQKVSQIFSAFETLFDLWETMARFSEERIERMLPRDDPWMKDEVKAQKMRYGTYVDLDHRARQHRSVWVSSSSVVFVSCQ